MLGGQDLPPPDMSMHENLCGQHGGEVLVG